MINSKNNIDMVTDEGKLIKSLNTISGKFNSEAYLYKYLDNYYVVRKIGKQYNLSPEQLVILEKNLHTYYVFLKRYVPINLPKTFFTKIDKNDDAICLVTEYFPKGKITEVKNISKKLKYFKIVSKLIIKLSSSNNNLYLNKLTCSIDPNPDNFFINSNSKVVYNDFTPPLYRTDGKWLEFRRQDELHTKKTDKEKRYFTGFNLLLVFVNKTRIHLPFSDYLKFVTWISKEIQNSNLSSENNLGKFPEVFNEIYIKKGVDLNVFEKYAVLRDLLRFTVSFNKDLTSDQIEVIYKNSKVPDGIKILTKKLYAKNQSSNSRVG
ncbi:hypothetical protein K8Q94_01675 [Candidatus Nomurabacteria bacterium]|nr:hypothetical protein [Candidatus Nomurabacteria bacterium]